MKAKVTKIENGDVIVFDNGFELYATHRQDCCETHYLDFEHIDLSDFNELVFDLSFTNGDKFFRRIEDYGIELLPIEGYSVKIPGYGSNNGYYSSNLTLILENPTKNIRKEFDISECQDINWS